MRKVIGIGETVLDIIFKDNQPIGAVPGGSVFNGVISLGRAGVAVLMVAGVLVRVLVTGVVEVQKRSLLHAIPPFWLL